MTIDKERLKKVRAVMDSFAAAGGNVGSALEHMGGKPSLHGLVLQHEVMRELDTTASGARELVLTAANETGFALMWERACLEPEVVQLLQKMGGSTVIT